MIAVLTIAQALLMAVLLFGDIGFDRPGRFGMSFGHGILLSFLYLVVLIFGIVYSCVKRKWYTLFSQTMIPLLVIVYTSWPATRYDAHEYQHLLGKTRDVVEKELDSRNVIQGLQEDEQGATEFVSYPGMTIHYSADGIVLRVATDNR